MKTKCGRSILINTFPTTFLHILQVDFTMGIIWFLALNYVEIFFPQWLYIYPLWRTIYIHILDLKLFPSKH